jgi:hypothetical protein
MIAPPELSAADKQLMETYVKYALIAVAAVVILKILASTIVIVAIFPLLFAYGISTCPPASTFDAKQQLKRVLRGHHLPESHPQKPKGFFEETVARVAATVTAELATLPGYSVEMTPLAGAAIWTSVQVPTANLQCYWLGANHQWYYIGSRELEPRNNHGSSGNMATTRTTTPSFTRPHHD